MSTTKKGSNTTLLTRPDSVTVNSLLRNDILSSITEKGKHASILIFTVFSFVGIISVLLFGGSNSAYDAKYGTYGSASLIIWGYGIALSSLTCGWLIKSSITGEGDVAKAPSIINVFTIIMIMWIISLNVTHFERINMKKVPSEYFAMSNWSLYLIIIQFCFFAYSLRPSPPDESNLKMTSFIVSILIACNASLVIIQQTILDHFSVDIL